MCLTIPKKVISVEAGAATVETLDGTRQAVKSIVKLSIGDYVLTQQNVVVRKLGRQEAAEIINLLKK